MKKYVLISSQDNSNIAVIDLGKSKEPLKFGKVNSDFENKLVQVLKDELSCPVKIRLVDLKETEPIMANVHVVVEAEDEDYELEIYVEQTFLY